ncbi:MAG: ATP:cob(I)alamin adenosyltransferase [Ignavibacteria bacterium RBG_13_36_8]|nr:MAG: ATP:cob(I)alamin adenosyltransferase [Ignavibacteria bacterium RBG_13_36_8]
MKIYTKTGDKGETSLFGGERVSKDDVRIDAYGSVDELNAIIGCAVTEALNQEVKDALRQVQNHLFIAGADLAAPTKKENRNFQMPRISENEIKNVEKKIDYFDGKIPELKHFILPGGTKGASFLQLARTVCRRAERKVVLLSKKVEIGDFLIIYLNRLSDLLFVLSRYENLSNHTPDIEWKK